MVKELLKVVFIHLTFAAFGGLVVFAFMRGNNEVREQERCNAIMKAYDRGYRDSDDGKENMIEKLIDLFKLEKDLEREEKENDQSHMKVY